MVNNAISTVEKNLIEGALIVIFVLVLFLGNLRTGLLVASVIPLSMLFAVILMNAFGSINQGNRRTSGGSCRHIEKSSKQWSKDDFHL